MPVFKETEKAIAITFDGQQMVWLPKSQIETAEVPDFFGKNLGLCVVKIAWFTAKQKGLLTLENKKFATKHQGF